MSDNKETKQTEKKEEKQEQKKEPQVYDLFYGKW